MKLTVRWPGIEPGDILIAVEGPMRGHSVRVTEVFSHGLNTDEGGHQRRSCFRSSSVEVWRDHYGNTDFHDSMHCDCRRCDGRLLEAVR